MIPGHYDLPPIYEGDSYVGWPITLPDLSPFGGPRDLVGASVRAEVRESHWSEEAVEFDVEVLDPVTRRVRLAASPERTLLFPEQGVWDLQVEKDGWRGTPLAGKVKKLGEVTR